MSIARIDVARSSMPDYAEYCEEIKDLWDSHWLTNMGAKHKLLEEQLETYLDTPHVVLFTNGHLALESILAAMNFPAGSEVITTPFTFISTTHAITRNGLTPVFCDVNDTDYNIDATKIEALITEKTVAIVPVHVYGNLCDVDAIDAIAKKHGLKVIYDAAHAFGVVRNGVGAANFGDASMLSFHATKVFNTIEGGAVAFRDAQLEQSLNDLKNFGIHNQESVVYVGGNAKMNEFQAAMGICNLRHIDEEIAKRKVVYNRYVERLRGVPGIKLIAPQKGVKPNYSYFPVFFDGYRYNRDQVRERLTQINVFARKYFYPLTNDMECYKEKHSASVANTPVAKKAAECVLTLPMYADLTVEDVDRICDIILK